MGGSEQRPPAEPDDAARRTSGFNNVDPQGNPTDPITNQLVNFGDEYVFHCHILSHEEMDMMRPVSIVTPPVKATGLATSILSINPGGLTGTVKLTWNDNTITDTAYVVQRMEGTGPWANIKVIPTPLSVTNTTGPMSYNDPNWQSTVAYQYRVIAQNTVGYGGAFPTMTAQSISNRRCGSDSGTERAHGYAYGRQQDEAGLD